MRQSFRIQLAILAAIWIAGHSAPAEAQIPGGTSTIPSAGYPRRTIQAIPATQLGLADGLAVPGRPNVPRGLPSLPTRGVTLGATNSSIGTSVGDVGSQYQYWSPTTAIWNIQQQLNLVEPMTMYGERLLSDPTLATAGTPEVRGRPSSAYGAQATGVGAAPAQPALSGPAREGVVADEEALPEMRLPTAEEIASGGLPLGPTARGLDIPFEQFETFEEFNEWLRQRIAAPGGGMVDQGMATGGPRDSSAPAAQRGQMQRRIARPEERPPIGYVGVGSSVTTPLGQMNLGPNVAAESARLANELNDFLHRSQSRQSSLWRQSNGSEARPPLPHSSLGRRAPSGTVPTLPNRAAPGVGGFVPQAQPRQYWQNLGGYELPSPRLEDWP